MRHGWVVEMTIDVFTDVSLGNSMMHWVSSIYVNKLDSPQLNSQIYEVNKAIRHLQRINLGEPVVMD